MIFSENKLNPQSRKRKSIQNESADELKVSDTEESSDEDVENKTWTCEVDGLKMLFKRIDENNLL